MVCFSSHDNNNNNNNNSNYNNNNNHTIMLIIVVAGMFELYEQLLPTRLYACQKKHTSTGEVMCRLCNKAPGSVAHVLAGCTALAQNK